MAKMDFEAILKKKRVTAREAGRLEIANALDYIAQSMDGEEQPALKVSNEEMQSLLQRALHTEEDVQIYDGYLSIHKWLSNVWPVSQAMEQQIVNCTAGIENIIKNAQRAEDIEKLMNQAPATVTPQQYRALMDARRPHKIQPRLERETATPDCFSLFGLIVFALDYCEEQLRLHPRKKNPLKELRPQLEARRVKSQLILDRYPAISGEGHYEFFSGTRSDMMPADDWKRHTQKIMEFVFSRDPVGKACSEEEREAIMGCVMRGESLQNVPIALRSTQAYIPGGFENFCHWVPADDVEIPSPWELITTHSFYDLFPAALLPTGRVEDMQAARAEYCAFYEDFADVLRPMAHFIKDQMKDYTASLLARILGDHLEDQPMFSFSQLYRNDFCGFASRFVEADAKTAPEARHLLGNGVSVLQQGDAVNKADLNAAETKKLLLQNSILSFLSEDPEEAFRYDDEDFAGLVRSDSVEETFRTLHNDCCWLTGYSKALDLLEDLFGLDCLCILRGFFGPNSIAALCKRLNSQMDELRDKIRYNISSDSLTRATKLRVLDCLFSTLSTKDFIIDPQKIEFTEENMKTFEAFRNPQLDPRITLRPDL